MSETFQIAPPRRNYDWDKAVAFALAPAATAGVAIHWLEGHAMIAVLVALVGFLGTLGCGLLLGRPDHGQVELDAGSLRITSARMQVRVALAELDLAAAALTPPRAAGDAVTLVTDPARTVTIPGHANRSVSVSPLDPERFLQALRTLARGA